MFTIVFRPRFKPEEKWLLAHYNGSETEMELRAIRLNLSNNFEYKVIEIKPEEPKTAQEPKKRGRKKSVK